MLELIQTVIMMLMLPAAYIAAISLFWMADSDRENTALHKADAENTNALLYRSTLAAEKVAVTYATEQKKQQLPEDADEDVN